MESNAHIQSLATTIRSQLSTDGILREIRCQLQNRMIEMMGGPKCKSENVCGARKDVSVNPIESGMRFTPNDMRITIMNQLFMEYLHWFGFKYTAQTFSMETTTENKLPKRESLEAVLGKFSFPKIPILLEIVSKLIERQQSHMKDIQNNTQPRSAATQKKYREYKKSKSANKRHAKASNAQKLNEKKTFQIETKTITKSQKIWGQEAVHTTNKPKKSVKKPKFLTKKSSIIFKPNETSTRSNSSTADSAKKANTKKLGRKTATENWKTKIQNDKNFTRLTNRVENTLESLVLQWLDAEMRMGNSSVVDAQDCKTTNRSTDDTKTQCNSLINSDNSSTACSSSYQASNNSSQSYRDFSVKKSTEQSSYLTSNNSSVDKAYQKQNFEKDSTIKRRIIQDSDIDLSNPSTGSSFNQSYRLPKIERSGYLVSSNSKTASSAEQQSNNTSTAGYTNYDDTHNRNMGGGNPNKRSSIQNLIKTKASRSGYLFSNNTTTESSADQESNPKGSRSAYLVSNSARTESSADQESNPKGSRSAYLVSNSARTESSADHESNNPSTEYSNYQDSNNKQSTNEAKTYRDTDEESVAGSVQSIDQHFHNLQAKSSGPHVSRNSSHVCTTNPSTSRSVYTVSTNSSNARRSSYHGEEEEEATNKFYKMKDFVFLKPKEVEEQEQEDENELYDEEEQEEEEYEQEEYDDEEEPDQFYLEHELDEAAEAERRRQQRELQFEMLRKQDEEYEMEQSDDDNYDVDDQYNDDNDDDEDVDAIAIPNNCNIYLDEAYEEEEEVEVDADEDDDDETIEEE